MSAKVKRYDVEEVAQKAANSLTDAYTPCDLFYFVDILCCAISALILSSQVGHMPSTWSLASSHTSVFPRRTCFKQSGLSCRTLHLQRV